VPAPVWSRRVFAPVESTGRSGSRRCRRASSSQNRWCRKRRLGHSSCSSLRPVAAGTLIVCERTSNCRCEPLQRSARFESADASRLRGDSESPGRATRFGLSGAGARRRISGLLTCNWTWRCAQDALRTARRDVADTACRPDTLAPQVARTSVQVAHGHGRRQRREVSPCSPEEGTTRRGTAENQAVGCIQ
jgi:hypothetical protein